MVEPRHNRFIVVDMLRFVLALCVVLGHVGIVPVFGPIDSPNHLASEFARLWRTTVWGTPAVIGFFVISGFCIHYPFRFANDLPVIRFYLRRYARVLMPLVCTVALLKLYDRGAPLTGSDSVLWQSTLWSLLCEEVYYAIYPIVRNLRHRYGWRVVLPAAFVLGAAVVWSHRDAGDWFSLGPFYTCVALYPVWLLGCVLAERADSLTALSRPARIWFSRFGAWVTMWIAEYLDFHGGVHRAQTAVLVGIVMFFWIMAEMRRYRTSSPPAYLVAAGRWSYSLYLTHPLVFAALSANVIVPTLDPRAAWCVTMSVILVGAYTFYLVVERPSHQLARRITLRPTKISFGDRLLEPAA